MAMSKLIKRKDGSYSKRGLWDNIRANAGSGKKPTKEMLKQEKKIKNLAEGGGIPERYKKMGFTHVGQKKEGDGQHKWKVLAKKGDSYKVVQGGYRGMKDFSQHHSEKRRSNFWNRMGGKNSAKANDPFSPLYWHKKLGKWEEGGKISHENDKEMVDGIADILQRVKDSSNRKEIANKMISDFKKENVNYNRKEFLTKSNLPQYQDGGWFKELISNLNPFTWFDDKPQDYKTAFADARKRGLDKFTWNDKEYTTKLKEEPVKAVAKVEEALPAGWQKFPDELLLWQAHKESGGFDPKVISGERVSSANAKGLTQIRPIALEEYHRLSKTPKGSIDLTKPEDAVKVQRYLMNEHYNSDAATKGNPTDLVRKAKALAFYNFGRVGTIDSLNKAKEEGHDIYTSLSWLDKLPLETSDYIKKILLHKIPSHNVKFHKDTTNSPYNQYYNFGRGGMLWFNQKGGAITDQRGQWAHPGKVTKIMGSDITMKGVPYPVFAESNKGQQVIMQPGQDYHFTGAKSVTEYPMATTHDYKISKYLLPQHKTGGTMDKLGNVPYDPADAHKKPLSNGLWALPFKKGGQIHIKPENKGKFTAWAKSHGMGVQQAASHVMANKGKYSSTVVKRANFAKNAAKWKHAFGGSIQALKMALGGKMETGGAFRPNRSSESGIMNFYENSSPKARMFEGGDFPNSTFGDKTIEAKSYKMGGHIELKRPDSWVQASDAVEDLNKNPQQSWYGESNRAKATAPVFQGGIKKPLMANGGKLGFKSKSKFSK